MAAARTGDPLTTRRSSTPLVVIAVLGVLVGVAGLLVPRFVGGGEDAERDAVVARVNDFATTYNTYDVADLASYQERMKPLLTPAYDKEFVRVTNAVFGALESKDQKSGDANVLAVAVDSIDKDSAIAIVAVDASITTSSDETAVQRRFRWKVTLSKSDGDWRVSQFDTVVPLDASTDPGSGGATPSPSASPSASQEGQ
ncbi:Mce-associated membrane protein [Aeromicrobium sp. SORGH_AS981]|uniref:hypothetical protein n=1 Tax=Aeromicrobium sp. SORGH_AS_0981 TaxID=3041802 RepID=UPI0028642B2C|nr:hypothetical protein [Aeromicrobium sp. SORGH_AS_0981]MDR6118638.1 Mce-associated membrane protein [Aeromicrobium sp. SORGH_AS_0981]